MALTPILNLPVAIGLDGTEWVPLARVSNNETLRAQTQTIANLSTGAGGGNLVGGSTTLTGGTNSYVLYDNNGVLGFEPPPATGLTVGTTTVAGATNGYLLYNNNGVLGAETAPSSGLTVGATTIAGGVNGRFLYDNAGALGEQALAAVATSGSAADLSSGILPDARMPDLTGDVTSADGSVTTTIASGAVTFAKVASGTIRELLTANRTYYVALTGNDSNNGLAVGTAWRTLQHAWNAIAATLDIGAFTVTIQLADGDYSGDSAIVFATAQTGLVTIQGNLADQTKVKLPTIQAQNTGPGCLLQYVVMGGLFQAINSGVSWYLYHVDFNTAAGSRHIGSDTLASVSLCQPVTFTPTHYTITGNFRTHMNIVNGGVMYSYAYVTLVGTPVIGSAFTRCKTAAVLACYFTPTGAATGQRYTVSGNAVIDTHGGGANNFPGDVAGTSATGGQYL